MNPAMIHPKDQVLQMHQNFIPLAIMAGSAIAGAIGKNKGQKNQAENQWEAQINREQNFDPFAPLRRGARGALWGATMKQWGFDKLFAPGTVEAAMDMKSVPGSDRFFKDGTGYKKPDFKGGGLGWDVLAGGLGAAANYGASLSGGDPFGRGGGGTAPGRTYGGEEFHGG